MKRRVSELKAGRQKTAQLGYGVRRKNLQLQ